MNVIMRHYYAQRMIRVIWRFNYTRLDIDLYHICMCPFGSIISVFSDEQGCITNFENTAAFSREYQAEQECMCDGEHMFECPEGSNGGNSLEGSSRSDSSLDRFLAQHLQINEHKNLVAKKFHVKKVFFFNMSIFEVIVL